MNRKHGTRNAPPEKRAYYPAFINLQGMHCVVVGGGKVAERKVASLLRSGAKVTVISPALTGALAKKKEKGIIAHRERNYRKGDLKGAFLVVAATSDEETNRKISGDAPCLVNVVDRPEMANFIVPSVVSRGLLTVAVSTSGASPALARALREEIGLLYGKEFGQFLVFLRALRKRALREVPDREERERFFRGAASPEILALLRSDGFGRAKEELLERFPGIRKKDPEEGRKHSP
ncbi:MAG: bifunctional precorrin-2 dehydrogenase/sirohydrochlorin ferrochelatase [Alphaproteobacteria bacterium]|uniref:precorrin-2 dehydrogenase n=1 Tax=Candidatus Nitrobium versatile TaxID=2884831 RepID=A0A953M1A3_9BACT|nr:bifunctional precorrin-2 dehydrogenase/sirohydrochlorin ferrochelatase [Candidatus Nitrobium versatile]